MCWEWDRKMSKENITQVMKDKWKKQIEYCIEKQERLNNWEIEFISSIYKYLENNNELSIKQSFTLNKIYNKY